MLVYHVPMQGAIRVGSTVIGLLIIGFVAAFASDSFLSARGAAGPTVMQSVAPFQSVLEFVCLSLASAILGAIVAKIATTNAGMAVFGFGYFVLAMNLAGFEEFVYLQGNTWLLVCELLFVAMLILLGSLLIFAVGGPFESVAEPKEGESASILQVLAIGLGVLPIIYLIAQVPDKGQVLGACVVGGIFVGFLTRKYLSSMQPIWMFAVPVACGAIGYVVGNQLTGFSEDLLVRRSVSHLLFPMPIEYAGGVVLGVSIGLNWLAFLSVPEEKQSG